MFQQIEEYLYKESFYFLCRYYPVELKLFAQTDKNLLNENVVSTFQFKRYKVGSIIDMSTGGIFLKGVASENIPELQSSNTKPRIFSGVSYIAPSYNKYYIRVTKTTRVFHFDNLDVIQELLTAEQKEREKQRTMSVNIAGFRKASMLQKKPTDDDHIAPAITLNVPDKGHTLTVPGQSALEKIDESDDDDKAKAKIRGKGTK